MSRLVDWTDPMGRKFRMAVADDAPDSEAEYGEPVGPPVLDAIGELGRCMDINVKIHNWLFDMGIMTAKEAQLNRVHISAAIQRAVALDVNNIIALYGAMEEPVIVARIVVPPVPESLTTPARRRSR